MKAIYSYISWKCATFVMRIKRSSWTPCECCLFLVGCLMVIAWVGFASIGIFMARYMKVAFGGKVLLGTKVWFTVRCGSLLNRNFRKITFSGETLQSFHSFDHSLLGTSRNTSLKWEEALRDIVSNGEQGDYLDLYSCQLFRSIERTCQWNFVFCAFHYGLVTHCYLS